MPHIQLLQDTRLEETVARRGGLQATIVGRCARQFAVETTITIGAGEAKRVGRDTGSVESLTCMSGMLQTCRSLQEWTERRYAETERI